MDPGAGVEPSSRYEVLAKIASGGMATVFVGRTRGAVGFSRLVAIKRPHRFVSADPALRKSFEREARVAAAIHHPHVVSVLDVEERNDEVSLVLDYVEGCALWDLLAYAEKIATPLPARAAVRVVLDVASGLHAAHVLCDRDGKQLGIVHRDVSPQNVLVGLDGHARITDFGIAKIASEVEHTASNVIKGKIRYLAPEYVSTKEFDARSDQYALAVVAWEALTGTRLFGGKGDANAIRRIVEGNPPAVSTEKPELTPLDAILARALSRDPRLRFDSVSAFAGALEECARSHSWVGSHEEVAGAVEAAVGTKLRERRGLVEASVVALTATEETGPRERPASPRDAVSTVSLAVPARGEPPAAPHPRRWLFGAGVIGLVVVGIAILGARGMRAGTADSAGSQPTADPPAVSSARPVSSVASLPSVSSGPPPAPALSAAPLVVSAIVLSAVSVAPAASAAPSASASPPSRTRPPRTRPAAPPPRPTSSVRFSDPG
jgi:tRNA A-37 threonylcarbamoyl transferase component Bud32